MEATPGTLAESLLDDLDDLSDADDEGEEEELASGTNNSKQDSHHTIQSGDNRATTTGRNTKLTLDPVLLNHLNNIRQHQNQQPQQQAMDQKQDEEYEHTLITLTNKHLVALANELQQAHLDLCHAYAPKFPELQELVVDPMQYKNAVRVICNEMDVTKVNDELNNFLTSNQIITISVAASTTSGMPLTQHQLTHVQQCADYMDDIYAIQKELTAFVESRMTALAPSMCALIGPSTAAKLVGLAGGLGALSNIPACNVQVLGQIKHNATSKAGLATTSTITQAQHHVGVLAECDLVQSVPSYLQKKTLKVVAAKLVLAARCDFVNVDTGRKRSATSGIAFRQEILNKIQEWQAPHKAQVLKALPKPDLTIKKRRGGKRMRRMKERFEETELMKQANTRAFSLQSGEYGDDAMGRSMGMLDTEGGQLRKTFQKRVMSQANTKASRKRDAHQMKAAAGSSTNANGLASSMVFTPMQGMELIDPDANRNRVKDANRKWFSDNAGFQSALPRK